ncbi:hypothetical protein [Spirillospora sp. NPDC048823]|uniref:hypothetical protein n=1 Tax=unclassified Spirillospora TaxID=2642701 RepID=UPI00371AD7D7
MNFSDMNAEEILRLAKSAREISDHLYKEAQRCGDLVLVARTGHDYHTSKSCPGLNSAEKVFHWPKEQAKDMRRHPCRRCST